jgi:hypothetical protein
VLARIKRAFKNNSPAELIEKSVGLATRYLKLAFMSVTGAIIRVPTDFFASKLVHPLRVYLLRQNHLQDVGRFIHLRDLTPINDEQWASARDIGSKIVSLRDRRVEIIKAESLNPTIALPGVRSGAEGRLSNHQ